MRLVEKIFLLLSLLLLVSAKDYSHHALFRMNLEESSHAVLFQTVSDRFDIWGKDLQGYHVFGEKSLLEKFFQVNSIEYQIISDQIQNLIEEEQHSRSGSPLAWFDDYHNLTETREWYQDLASSYPRIAKFVDSVGKTWESRDIFAFHITGSTNSTRPKIWIQCNIHAREWITGATCQFIVNELLIGYNRNSEITSLINSCEFIFIPIVNPDGYEYTWKTDRLWRKNRRNNGNSYGVDLNRNFDAQWGGVGSSPTPSSDTYRGPSVASEPETQALVRYYSSFSNIVGAIDMHSYSQYVLRPYTHANTSPKDEAKMKIVTDEMARIIKTVHGETYISGRWYSTLYASSGVAQDYYYSKGAYGVTLELRPKTSIPGFILPPEEIIPTGEEITPSVIYFAQYVIDNPLI